MIPNDHLYLRSHVQIPLIPRFDKTPHGDTLQVSIPQELICIISGIPSNLFVWKLSGVVESMTIVISTSVVNWPKSTAIHTLSVKFHCLILSAGQIRWLMCLSVVYQSKYDRKMWSPVNIVVLERVPCELAPYKMVILYILPYGIEHKIPHGTIL